MSWRLVRWIVGAAIVSLAVWVIWTGLGRSPTPLAGKAIELDLGALPPAAPPLGPQPLANAPVSPLGPGTFRTMVGPRVTFTVDDRWSLEAMDANQAALLFGSYAPMNIAAPRLEWVDLTGAGARVVPQALRGVVGSVGADEFARWEPLPRDLAGWFADNSPLTTGQIEAAVVGGRAARSFTFTVPDLPPGAAACVVWACERIFGGENWGWPVLEGDVGRIWIVEVDDHTLLIQLRSQPNDADLVMPAGSTVVSSLRIEGVR